MSLVYPITDYPVAPPQDVAEPECQHVWEIRRFVVANGVESWCPECQVCFDRQYNRRYGKKRAQAEFGLTTEELDQLPDVNETARQRRIDEYHRGYQWQRLKRRQLWFEWYAGYMASAEWYARRLAVLKRDGNKCQGCGADAEQVHHLTYERVGREQLEDLVSVCERCHRFLHRSPA